jgi:flagellar motor protein MotB
MQTPGTPDLLPKLVIVPAGITSNIDLSSKRADAVVAYFRSQGVNPEIISVKRFGGTHPVASNDTQADRAKNRRIEITVQETGTSGA